MATVVISPHGVAGRPGIGGHLWVYLQYAHGLRRLGCDVFWLEQVRPGARPGAVAGLLRELERWGLGGRAILYETAGGEGGLRFLGVSAAHAEAVLRRADLLLNFHYAMDPGVLARFRRTALVDIDPGLLQFWISRDQLRVAAHDAYLTTGETVGTAGARFPDCGLAWRHIRPPVCLDLWPYVHDPACTRFTTVSSWLAGEYVVEGPRGARRVLYANDKRESFLGFADLPRLVACELELALFLEGRLDAADRRLLEDRGWRVRHSREVAATPGAYRAYIQGSRGELSCAKPSCLAFQNAWVSDRTLCYLASGKPAVVQHTGPSSLLPSGAGLFRFRTPAEAAEALAAVDADYPRHCRAARELAEALFDARTVLAGTLDAALGGGPPPGGAAAPAGARPGPLRAPRPPARPLPQP